MWELEDVVLAPQRITKPLQCPCCEMAYTSNTAECSSIEEDEGVDGGIGGCGSGATEDYKASPVSLLRDGIHFNHSGMQQYWRR